MKHSFLLLPTAFAAGLIALSLGAAEKCFIAQGEGEWSEAANWDPVGVPGPKDEILLRNASVIVRAPVKVAALTLKGTSRLHVEVPEPDDLRPFAPGPGQSAALWRSALRFDVAGRFAVMDESVVVPECAPISGIPVIFRAKDFYLGEKAEFNAVRCGWAWSRAAFSEAPAGALPRVNAPKPCTEVWTLAPGAGCNYNRGGNYGFASEGFRSSDRPYCASYGNELAPFLPGSPSGCYYLKPEKEVRHTGRGPGSIVLFVSNRAIIDGRLVADADPVNNTGWSLDGGRASGGGIWLAVGSFVFGPGARLSARGGSPTAGNQFGPGAGGRIAVAVGLGFGKLEALALGGDSAKYTVSDTIGFVAADVDGGHLPKDPGDRGRIGTVRTVLARPLGSLVSVLGDPVPVKVKGGGTREYGAGKTLEFSAPEYAADPTDGRFRYRCLGYTVSNETSKVRTGRGTKVAVRASKQPITITWKWGEREYRPRSTRPVDATPVALVAGAKAEFEKPLEIAGTPEALGVEWTNQTAAAEVELRLVDAKKKPFSVTVRAKDAYTLEPLDRGLAYPLTLAGWSAKGGEVKSVRALYAEPLGRAGRHFASVESRSQPLGGRIVEAEGGETVELDEDTELRLVLHRAKGCQLEIEWEEGKPAKTKLPLVCRDQTEKTLGEFLGLPKGTPWTVTDSFIAVRNWWLCVRPHFRPYRSNREMVPMGWDYLADAEQLPPASEHVSTFAFRRLHGRDFLWWDGSQIATLPELAGERKPRRVKSLRVVLGPGAEYSVVRGGRTGFDRDRYELVDLAANPRAKAFKDGRFVNGLKPGLNVFGGVPFALAKPLDSADVAIAHVGRGGWALEVDEYTGRNPGFGFGAAAHWRVPAKDYVRAHLVFALDDAKKKDRVLTVRVARYMTNGSGMNMVDDHELDFSQGIPKNVTRIGTVERNGAFFPLYSAAVELADRNVKSDAARESYLDFEFLGVKSGSKPDAKRESAFNIFAATLESLPVTLDIVPPDGAPGNIFTADETDRSFALRFRGERADAAKAAVGWRATDDEGRLVFKGKQLVGPVAKGETGDVKLDLSEVKDCGLYYVDVAVKGDGGATALRYRTRFAILPESGRLVSTEDSPYGTWWFKGTHGSPFEWEVGGAVMQKAGIRKSCHRPIPDDMRLKYGVTATGQVYVPGAKSFDYETGKFKPADGLDGEQWFVTNITKSLAATPYADHVLIWHESGPRNGIPEEILGLPVPEATEDDRKAAAYLNECGRLLRKHFPKLRIQIGNNSASLGAACRPFRGGADPKYVDAIGIETPSQTMMPERLLVWGLQGMMMAKESISKYAGRPVPAGACYEYTYRTEQALGEKVQAEWYMRDVLISLANEMPLIPPAITFDVKSGYYATLWGRAGMLYRGPFVEPKLSYVAYAALTKALDGVKFLGELPTGSTTVYALSFRRTDGRYATAVWCARGEAELEFTGGGRGEVMDMVGRKSVFDARRVGASESPAYVVTDEPVTAVRIVKRGFREAETAAARASTVFDCAKLAGVKAEPDQRIKSKGTGCLPMMVPSEDFSVRGVRDAEKGEALEVRLDVTKRAVNRYYTEYTTLRLPEPVDLPKGSSAIGVWVKGNSSWGQIRFELTDANGCVFVNYAHPTLWDTLDWQGLLCVNFDGWSYISCRLPDDSGLRYEKGVGLRNSPWNREVGGRGFTQPAKLTAITVGMNREKLDLIDFKPTEPVILLGKVGIEMKNGGTAGGKSDDVKIVIGGAEAE